VEASWEPGVGEAGAEIAVADDYLETQYRPVYNAEFAQPAFEPGSAFVPSLGGALEHLLSRGVLLAWSAAFAADTPPS